MSNLILGEYLEIDRLKKMFNCRILVFTRASLNERCYPINIGPMQISVLVILMIGCDYFRTVNIDAESTNCIL